jgi:hypothetical protein
VTSWDGAALLVYLPELRGAFSPSTARTVRLLVADDGSTYFDPGTEASGTFSRASYAALLVARPSAGQVLPIVGDWPLRQRVPVMRDLSHDAGDARLADGELGIDPELGRFALPDTDALRAPRGLSVDYVEAFSDRVGARTFDQRLGTPAAPATRLVRAGRAAAWSSEATDGRPVHPSLEDAVRAAQDGDTIEVIDSATYTSGPLRIPERVHKLVIRAAAGQRPCLRLEDARASLRLGPELAELELRGLLLHGVPLRIASGRRTQLRLIACTLVVPSARGDGRRGSIVASDVDPEPGATVELLRCISGGIHLGAAVRQLSVQDSIVDQRSGTAIEARQLSAERVTVLGEVTCETLEASDCLFSDRVIVEDRQSGFIRFSRAERGSQLPCRFHCLPPPDDGRSGAMRPRFNSLRAERPGYCQLADNAPPELQRAAEDGGEIGAFAGALSPARLENVQFKLAELLPAGMTSHVVTVT